MSPSNTATGTGCDSTSGMAGTRVLDGACPRREHRQGGPSRRENNPKKGELGAFTRTFIDQIMRRRLNGGGVAQRKQKNIPSARCTCQARGSNASSRSCIPAPGRAIGGDRKQRDRKREGKWCVRGRTRASKCGGTSQQAAAQTGRGWGWLRRVGAALQYEAKQEGKNTGRFKWAGERERRWELATVDPSFMEKRDTC